MDISLQPRQERSDFLLLLLCDTLSPHAAGTACPDHSDVSGDLPPQNTHCCQAEGVGMGTLWGLLPTRPGSPSASGTQMPWRDVSNVVRTQ